MEHDFETSEEWHEALKLVAAKHDNKSAVRDFDGWTMNWENETPEEAYYSEYPEHKGSQQNR